MTRLRAALAAAVMIAAAATTAAPAVAAVWDRAEFMQAQAQKGRPGPEGGAPDRGRDMRQQERQVDRRERMSEDDRRSLHRDLDKANRELYGRRFQK